MLRVGAAGAGCGLDARRAAGIHQPGVGEIADPGLPVRLAAAGPSQGNTPGFCSVLPLPVQLASPASALPRASDSMTRSALARSTALLAVVLLSACGPAPAKITLSAPAEQQGPVRVRGQKLAL